MLQLLSLQVGQPREENSSVPDGLDRVWTSAIGKTPVAGRVRLNRLGLVGDSQADLKNHGGLDKAVCCYASEHYPGWRTHLGRAEAEFPFGAFGENFTLGGLTENNVCIGDVFQLGKARVQVSQPRIPCWKLGRRWERASFPHEVQMSGRTGWYLRVLEPGEVEAGDVLTPLEHPLPDWTIAHLNQAMYAERNEVDIATKLSRLPPLAEAWRGVFRKRANLDS